jgi:microcystin-dependent protein
MTSTHYTKITWVNSGVPALSETNMNHLESQYECAVVIGEIKLFSGSTVEMPDSFLLCNGTSYAVASYAALFAVTSNRYGGDSTYFSVPNMAGIFPVGAGGSYTVGATGGSSDVTLTQSQIPTHTHTIPAISDLSGGSPGWVAGYGAVPTTDSGSIGGGAAHENRPPYLVLSYIIRYR